MSTGHKPFPNTVTPPPPSPEQRIEMLETMVAALLHQLRGQGSIEGLRRYFEQERPAAKPIDVEWLGSGTSFKAKPVRD